MKFFKYLIVLSFLAAVINSCKKDTYNDTSFASKVITPANLSVLFKITQDNSGTVTIIPSGEGVSFFEVFFGDSKTDSAKVIAASTINHIYPEGIYNVRIVAHSITGGISEITKPLTVSFRAPESLDFSITPTAGNKFKVGITATALYETMFQVYFGDAVNEVPLLFLQGDTVSHTYTTFGIYNIKVVALSGGVATTQLIKTYKLTTAQIDLPVTFDDVKFDYTTTDFGGGTTVDAIDTTNSNNKVKRTLKPVGSETWAGVTIGTPLGFATPIPLTAASNQMSIRVFSPAVGIHIRLKVENHTDGKKSVETEALSTVANAWETLTFDFNNNASGTPAFNSTYTYDKASLFFDFGNVGTGKIFYWDDVKYIVAPQTILSIPIDFESSAIAYNFTNFDGGMASVVANPFATGADVSSKVAKMVKGAGQTWGGTYLTMPSPINFASKKTFKMKVYSPRVGAKILFKVENLTNGAVSFEKEMASTVANAWETITFDYSAVPTNQSFSKITLIWDNGTAGDGSANYTFYFDDISLN